MLGDTINHPRHPQTTSPSSDKPEWVRLPAPGARCRHTGLSRTTLNELAIPSAANDWKPPVKSVVVKKRGAMRGIRLLSYDSLMGHLQSLERNAS